MPQGVECSFAVVSDGCKFDSTFTKTMSTKIFQSYIYKKALTCIHIYTYTCTHICPSPVAFSICVSFLQFRLAIKFIAELNSISAMCQTTVAFKWKIMCSRPQGRAQQQLPPASALSPTTVRPAKWQYIFLYILKAVYCRLNSDSWCQTRVRFQWY